MITESAKTMSSKMLLGELLLEREQGAVWSGFKAFYFQQYFFPQNQLAS